MRLNSLCCKPLVSWKTSAIKVLTRHCPVHCRHVPTDLPHTCNEIPSGQCCGSQVAVLYASDYGFSDRLSQTIARGITKANVAVEMLDLLSADPQVPIHTCRMLSLRVCCASMALSPPSAYAELQGMT